MERHGRGGVHRYARHRAVARVDAARHVDGDDRRAVVVQHLDGACDLVARRAREAGAEQGVDEDRGARERVAVGAKALPRAPFEANGRSALQAREADGGVAAVGGRVADAHDGDVAASAAQDARRHEAVTAVVARAAEHDDPAVGCLALHRTGDLGSGPLHQVDARDAVLVDRGAIDGTHLLCVRQRKQPVCCNLHGRRS